MRSPAASDEARRLQPVEEAGIAEKPVLHHLAVTRKEVAGGQRFQHRGVGQHEGGLVEGADEVLAVDGIDAGLAADGTVDLRQERRRDLHEAHAPPQDRRGEAREIADHAAAQRDDHVAALHLLLQKPVDRARELRPAFRRLAGRQRERHRLDPAEPRSERLQMEPGHGRVCQDRDPAAAEKRPDLLARAREEARADAHVVAALSEIHADGVCRCCHVLSRMSDRPASAARTFAAISSTEYSGAASTITWACA